MKSAKETPAAVALCDECAKLFTADRTQTTAERVETIWMNFDPESQLGIEEAAP